MVRRGLEGNQSVGGEGCEAGRHRSRNDGLVVCDPVVTMVVLHIIELWCAVDQLRGAGTAASESLSWASVTSPSEPIAAAVNSLIKEERRRSPDVRLAEVGNGN